MTDASLFALASCDNDRIMPWSQSGVTMLVRPSGRKKILIFFQILRPFLAPFEIQEIEDRCMSRRNEVVLAATDAMFGWDS